MSLKVVCVLFFVKELFLRFYIDKDFFLFNINKLVVLKFLEENICRICLKRKYCILIIFFVCVYVV